MFRDLVIPIREHLGVIVQYFNERFLFVEIARRSVDVIVADRGIEESGDMEIRGPLFQHPVVCDGFGDALRGEYRMVFAVERKRPPIIKDVLDDFLEMFEIARSIRARVLGFGHVVLNPFKIFAVIQHGSCHGDLLGVHEVQIRFLFRFIRERFGFIGGFRLGERHLFAHVFAVERAYHIGVEGEHVLIPDAVGKTVAAYLASEDVARGAVLLRVLFFDGRAGEPEEQSAGERASHLLHHLPEGRSMALVHDEHDSLRPDPIELFRGKIPVIFADVAHLLDRGDYQRVFRVVAFEFRPKIVGARGFLYGLRIVGETAVIIERLIAELDAVEQEHHLVGVLRFGYKLGAFEARHRFTGSGRVPDVSATGSGAIPACRSDDIRDAGCRIVLIAAHNFEAPVRGVCDGIESHELMGHGDREKVSDDILPIVDPIIVEIAPMEDELREIARFSWIREIHGFVRVHRYEDLHEIEQPCENALMRVFLYLIACLRDRDAARLQLDVYEGHPIDEQHDVAPPVVEARYLCFETRLLCYLVYAPSACNVASVVDIEAHFLPEMSFVCRVVAFNGDGTAVDEPVYFHWSA